MCSFIRLFSNDSSLSFYSGRDDETDKPGSGLMTLTFVVFEFDVVLAFPFYSSIIAFGRDSIILSKRSFVLTLITVFLVSHMESNSERL